MSLPEWRIGNNILICHFDRWHRDYLSLKKRQTKFTRSQTAELLFPASSRMDDFCQTIFLIKSCSIRGSDFLIFYFIGRKEQFSQNVSDVSVSLEYINYFREADAIKWHENRAFGSMLKSWVYFDKSVLFYDPD